MSRAQNLARAIERTFQGPMWHGPALRELLAGVTPELAAEQPPGLHSIWQQVLHVTAWTEIARQRLEGATPDVPEAENWPTVADVSANAWAAALDRLARSHHDLAHAVESLDDARLSDAVQGQTHKIGTMLHGVVEHSTYHGGQIAQLKKLLAGQKP